MTLVVMDSQSWEFEIDDCVDVMTCKELVAYLSDKLRFPPEDMKELESKS